MSKREWMEETGVRTGSRVLLAHCPTHIPGYHTVASLVGETGVVLDDPIAREASDYLRVDFGDDWWYIEYFYLTPMDEEEYYEDK